MTFKEFADKMLNDKEFRHEIRENPKAALERAGMKPTEEQVNALKKINYDSLNNVAKVFGDTTIVT